MRLLFIDRHGGDSNRIGNLRWRELGKRLVESGHQVTVFTTAGPDSSPDPQKEWIRIREIDGIRVFSIRLTSSPLMGFMQRCWAFLSFIILAAILGVGQRRQDAVLAASNRLSERIPGMILSRIRGIPFVIDRDILDDGFIERMEKTLIPSAPGLEFAIKNAIDFVGGMAGVVLFSPILLAIALAIKLDSPGPVFFIQVRAGRKGRPFSMYKFRTMVHGADAMGLGLNVESEDARITRVGHFLRNWSLDELAQILNILRMQMSFIGPRPMLPEQAEKLSGTQRRRLEMKPGITGLAQVSGRNLLDWSAKIEKDVQYVSDYSLWMDLRIFLRTFQVVISRKGLYEPDAGLNDEFNRLDPDDE